MKAVSIIAVAGVSAALVGCGDNTVTESQQSAVTQARINVLGLTSSGEQNTAEAQSELESDSLPAVIAAYRECPDCNYVEDDGSLTPMSDVLKDLATDLPLQYAEQIDRELE